MFSAGSVAYLPSRCVRTRGSWCGRKRAIDSPRYCLLARDCWGWYASAGWPPYTGVSSANGLSHDLMLGPEMVLLHCCCCPAAPFSAYLDLPQLIYFIHSFRSHSWSRNLEATRGNFLFLTRNYSPPTD